MKLSTKLRDPVQFNPKQQKELRLKLRKHLHKDRLIQVALVRVKNLVTTKNKAATNKTNNKFQSKRKKKKCQNVFKVPRAKIETSTNESNKVKSSNKPG